MPKTPYPEGPSPRTTVKRGPHRAHYDRDTLDAILDGAFVCHIAYIHDGSPYVKPTNYGRAGDTLYFHGSPAGRLARTIKDDGAEISVAVTIVDAIVAARSSYNHSMGYRSAFVIGRARPVDDPEERETALEAITNAVLPGRYDEAREPNRNEDKGTFLFALPIDEYSAKIRGNEVNDEDEDYGLPIWAGAIPLRIAAGQPEPDPRLSDDIEIPASVSRFIERNA